MNKTYTDLRSFLAVIAVLETLGAKVTTDNDNNTVVAVRGGKTIAQWFNNSGFIDGDAEALAFAHRKAKQGTTRQEVYAAIDSERLYQNSTWPGNTSSSNPLTIGEFVLLIEQYAALARDEWTKEKKPEMNTLNIIRKIAGIAVNAMEQHGAPRREGL